MADDGEDGATPVFGGWRCERELQSLWLAVPSRFSVPSSLILPHPGCDRHSIVPIPVQPVPFRVHRTSQPFLTLTSEQGKRAKRGHKEPIHRVEACRHRQYRTL